MMRTLGYVTRWVADLTLGAVIAAVVQSLGESLGESGGARQRG